MKKLTLILALCMMLCACTSQTPGQTDPAATPPETTAGEPLPSVTEAPAPGQTETRPTESQVWKFTLYTPNDTLDGFFATTVVITGQTAQDVANELILEKALNEDVTVNSATLEGTQLKLDFNGAFRDQLLSCGSTGERMMMGSVVNTFLNAYGAESVTITVDGEILESGHVVYDFPMEFYE